MVSYIDHGDYEEIVVGANEAHTITLTDGQTYANKLIDITNDGATVRIDAIDIDDWTLRDVGVRGEHPGEENVLRCNVASEGSTGRVEHCYFGDGFVPGSRGGIFVMASPAHRGDLLFKAVHISLSSNNGIYASAPGYNGQPGGVDIEDCYAYSNNITNYRLGTAAKTSYIRNSVVHVTDDVNACDMNCSSPGTINARGVWAWRGEVVLDGVDIDTGGYGSPLVERDDGQATITYEGDGVRTGSNADTTPPAAVPMDATEAATSGTAAGDVVEPESAWRIAHPGGAETIPLYDPADVDTPALRMGLPTDTGVPGPAVPRFEPATESPDHALRVATPDGVYALGASAATVLEDFEHGQWPHEWADETDGFALTTNALRGSYALECTSATFPQVVNPNISTPRDGVYAMRLDMRGGSSRPGLMVNTSRATAAFSNGSFYMAQLMDNIDELRLTKHTNGSQSTLGSTGVSVGTHTEYHLGIRLYSGGLEAVLTDAEGTELAVTPWASDTQLTGGYLGLYMGGNDPVGTRVDEIARHPHGTL